MPNKERRVEQILQHSVFFLSICVCRFSNMCFMWSTRTRVRLAGAHSEHTRHDPNLHFRSDWQHTDRTHCKPTHRRPESACKRRTPTVGLKTAADTSTGAPPCVCVVHCGVTRYVCGCIFRLCGLDWAQIREVGPHRSTACWCMRHVHSIGGAH